MSFRILNMAILSKVNNQNSILRIKQNKIILKIMRILIKNMIIIMINQLKKKNFGIMKQIKVIKTTKKLSPIEA